MLLGIAAALALAALAAAALFLTRVRVSGVVTLDSTGHQLLMLDCPRCAEGSAVAVQGVAGKLAAGKVTLRLEPELEPGHQELTVEVGRPPHEYAVTVPVMARFTPDIAPLSEGHTLVIPKERKAFLHELSDEQAAAIGRVLPRLARAVMNATGATAYNILQNNGTAAHQAVFHVHFHIIPRHGERGLGIGWSTSSLDHAAAPELIARIAAALES